MNTPTIQSTSLYFREGNSDKEYHAAIEPEGEGYIVTFAYGRRGNTLTTGTKTPHIVTLEQATAIHAKLIREKSAKGYSESGESGETAKPYRQSGSEGNDSGIRCQLLNPVERTELMRLITNRTHCLQPKHDGRRLMVRKQGDTITGINRRGLVVAVPDAIREAVEHIPFDVLIDGEAVGDTLHAFD
ncbi:MAG: WGR domain-containing protein, partial [Akkermansiaceae bacterium]